MGANQRLAERAVTLLLSMNLGITINWHEMRAIKSKSRACQALKILVFNQALSVLRWVLLLSMATFLVLVNVADLITVASKMLRIGKFVLDSFSWYTPL